MKLQIYGDYVFEFLLITFLMCISLCLVIPFPLILVGITGYFKTDIHERRYKDIFIHIKENIKILIIYTAFQLCMIIIPILNIYYFNMNLDQMNNVIYVVSYVILILGIIILISAPTIIINMNVSFTQLIFNSFILLFGNLKNTLYSILLIIVLVLLVLYFPYIVIFTFYIIILFNSKFMKENLEILRTKSLKKDK